MCIYATERKPLSQLRYVCIKKRMILQGSLILTLLALSLWSIPARAVGVEEIENDVETVREAIAFDLNNIAAKAERPWVVAKVTPDKDSGIGIVGSFSINGKTDEAVRVPGGQDFELIKGSFRVVSTLTGTVSEMGMERKYRWQSPIDMWSSDIRGAHPDVPSKIPPRFREGGWVVFRWSEDLSDPAQLLPGYPLPADWQEHIQPAWQFFQKNPDLFKPELAAARREQLWKLLEGNNPILAIEACRTLAAGPALDQTFIEGPVSRSTGYRQAAFVYLLMKMPAPTGSTTVDDLRRLIETAERAEKVQGLALGALMILRDGQPTNVNGFRLLDALEQRLSNVALPNIRNDYLSAVLNKAALPLLRRNSAFMRSVAPLSPN